MATVAITTLGCKINQFESAAMAESLGKDGFQVVSFDGAADIYVINTCTVTAKTDAESRRLIRRAQRWNPEARIVVTGCYAQVAYDELKEMPGVNMILGNTEKKGIADLLKEIGGEQLVLVSDIAEEGRVEGLALESFAEHTRAFLQVQNGCDAYCSYCIVPYARGRSRSVSIEEAVAGVASFVGKGFREVVLTGIHLGGYGLDLKPASNLLLLMEEIESRTGVERLRIGSLEPTEIPDAMIRFIAASPVVCPHLHIPLQSGSDTVLQRMNRKYDTTRFRQVIDSLVCAIPDICIGADIIAGFPGETDQEFADSLAFVQSLPLAYLHVFPYSPRDGTPAATMPGQIDPKVIRDRAQALRRVSEEKKKAYYRRFIGRELLVLVQGMEGEGINKGLARNYVPVRFAGEDTRINSEVRVRITGVERDIVRGDLVRL